MEIVSVLAEKYIADCSPIDDIELYKIYVNTLQTHAHQHMQSSWIQGQFLTFMSCILQPKYILEIGTFTGFSALCLAKGLQPTGELHTIELRETDATTAQQNFSISPQKNQIHLHCGNAKEIIPTLPYQWDLVFIDADKTSYVDYYKMVFPNLSKNGVIIADNVLFHGQVFDENITGKSAKAINEFNKYVANDKAAKQVILTVRDGLMLIRKSN